jgi:hypothetical protein
MDLFQKSLAETDPSFSLICVDLGNKELIELLFSRESPSLANFAAQLELNATD